mmetsp:Transcript_12514/g.37573  ORF Transcript_12514/g.37573 Transcript_12514/m.37573 type:complete len:108 (+) Transcript_12514:551-874(+)
MCCKAIHNLRSRKCTKDSDSWLMVLTTLQMNVPNMLSASLGRRWRAERNFWLSALTFFSWCVLARLYVVVRRLAQLNDRIEELQSPTGPIKDVPEPVDVVEELKKAK